MDLIPLLAFEMLGLKVTPSQKQCIQVKPALNESTLNKGGHFFIGPNAYMEFEFLAKKQGLELLGFYHSHPHSLAKPSLLDINYAWPFFSYIILSVGRKKFLDIRSYVMDIKNNIFLEEALCIG